MRTIERYVCEICAKDYATPEEAAKCERRGRMRQRFKVGAIVTAGAGFGWFDGDKRWVSNPGALKRGKKRSYEHKRLNCMSACCTYRFYYVVSAVERPREDPHGIRYHLFTGAMTGNDGYQAWWIEDPRRYLQRVVAPPKLVVEASKAFIGKLALHQR